MPKISIIMPVYNKQDYLERSLDSVLNQDFSDFELIVIDDGSVDNSLQIIEKYQKKDSRIRIIRTKNCGVSHARNVGLDNCVGEYLTFVDGDDELKHGYLRDLLAASRQSKADLVIQGFTRVYSDGHTKDVDSGLERGIFQLSDFLPDFAEIQKKSGIFGYCVSKLFPVSLTKDIRFDESLTLAEDFDFYLKLYRKIKTIYFDNRSNYMYYQSVPGSSVDIKDEDINYKGQFNVNCRYRDFIVDQGAFYGRNKTIITGMIYSSAYHMLLYSNENEIEEECLLLKERADVFEGLKNSRLFQKMVLFVAVKGNYRIVRFLINSYKTARALKRRVSR